MYMSPKNKITSIVRKRYYFNFYIIDKEPKYRGNVYTMYAVQLICFIVLFICIMLICIKECTFDIFDKHILQE